jgi:L-asparagine oxygenase
MSPTFKENINNHGYAILREHCSGSSITEVANTIGRPLTPWQGGLIQELVPRSNSTPNTYSGIYGLNSFPFHTDLAHWRNPPRYLLLRCLIGSPEVPTLLLDGQAIFDDTMLDILRRAIFTPRRPRGGTLTLLRLYEPTDSGYCFRWDEKFLKPASRIGEQASHCLRKLIEKSQPTSIALVRLGDTLLIDNWRMLHARSQVPAGHEDRKFQRIYLENLH